MEERDLQCLLYELEYGKPWANCPTPDCENKVCDWALEGVCAPCSLRKVGPTVMIARYNRSHPDTPWTESFPPGGKERS